MHRYKLIFTLEVLFLYFIFKTFTVLFYNMKKILLHFIKIPIKISYQIAQALRFQFLAAR